MAATMYKMPNGGAKISGSQTGLTGTETIDASVGAGEVAIIVNGGVTLNTNILDATINNLRDLQKEFNK